MAPFFPPRPKAESIRTAICHEQPSDSNPFVAQKTLWHGYDAAKLAERHGWTEILFLLARGELPSPAQDRLLNRLMAALANPGPRDAAVRAAMNCGVGKTSLPTILSTGLTVRGGMAEGAMHIEAAMWFLAGQLPADPERNVEAHDHPKQLVDDYRRFWQEHHDDEVVALPEIPPGFGLHYGDRDPRALELLRLVGDDRGAGVRLALAIEGVLAAEETPLFLTLPGVAAAVLRDLGFSPEHGAGIFLIAGSAGILTHGVEQLPRNWNEYPFWNDKAYYNYEGPVPDKKVEDVA